MILWVQNGTMWMMGKIRTKEVMPEPVTRWDGDKWDELHIHQDDRANIYILIRDSREEIQKSLIRGNLVVYIGLSLSWGQVQTYHNSYHTN